MFWRNGLLSHTRSATNDSEGTRGLEPCTSPFHLNQMYLLLLVRKV
jgi:hypothetical protein